MDGIIIIDKEKGITSFGVVSALRKILNTKKIGHCGTLDPETTGVLPIMIGTATKVSKYLVEHDKEYIATIKFGIKTDTADSEGKIIEKDNFILNNELEEEYIKKIKSIIGVQKQVPPMYSAIKVNGKKLYQYAREGIEIERKAREIEIYNINIEKINYKENEITFKVFCSKGTYVRTLCETIAERFGTVGYMKNLKRTKVDKFDIKDSITINKLENLSNKESVIISIEELFNDKERIILDDRKKELFLNGVKLTEKKEDEIYRVYNNETFLGLGIVKNNLLKRDVII